MSCSSAEGVYQTGEASKGVIIFKQRCAECHTVEKSSDHGHGPNLFGLFGRRSGEAPGYSGYSTTIVEKGIGWDTGTLHLFLEDPKKFIPGNKMFFTGLRKERERADLITYLQDVTRK